MRFVCPPTSLQKLLRVLAGHRQQVGCSYAFLSNSRYSAASQASVGHRHVRMFRTPPQKLNLPSSFWNVFPGGSVTLTLQTGTSKKAQRPSCTFVFSYAFKLQNSSIESVHQVRQRTPLRNGIAFDSRNLRDFARRKGHRTHLVFSYALHMCTNTFNPSFTFCGPSST